MSIAKLTSPVYPNDLITKTNEIIDGLDAAGTAIPTTTTPIMDGTATVGTETNYARGDHVHPTDTSRAAASHVHNASDITSGTLPVARGGTGETSLDDLFDAMGLGSAAKLNSDAVFRIREFGTITNLNDVQQNGAYYVNASASSSMSNLPVASAGTLLHFNPRGTTTFDYALQFYTNNSRTNFVLYFRKKQQSTWGSWKSITFA